MLDVTLSSHEVSLDLMPGPVSGHHLTGRRLLCFSINFDQYIFRLTICFKDIIIVCKMCTCITVLHLKNYAHGSCVSAFLGFYFTGTRIIILLSQCQWNNPKAMGKYATCIYYKPWYNKHKTNCIKAVYFCNSRRLPGDHVADSLSTEAFLLHHSLWLMQIDLVLKKVVSNIPKDVYPNWNPINNIQVK